MSRDPTVPVNLTSSTPVGPVERTLAATQATDRVERLRYWRRGGGGVAYAPMAFFDGSYLWGDPDTDSPWVDPGNTTGCTIVAEFRVPALPIVANWCFGGVGAYGGAQHNRVRLMLTPAGEIYVLACSRLLTATYPLSATTAAGSIQVDTRYMVHAAIDTTSTGTEIRVWINGVLQSVTLVNTGWSGTDEFDWGSTAAVDASRRGAVGIQVNSYGTGGTVTANSRIGYIDGGAGDVPVEMGLFFFSTEKIADPTVFTGTAGLDLSAYASTAQMIFGHTPTYDAAAWAAGRNDGTGPDIDLAP